MPTPANSINLSNASLRINFHFFAFLADESGQDLIEYALVAALVGLGAVTSMKGLSTRIGNAFNSIGTSLTTDV